MTDAQQKAQKNIPVVDCVNDAREEQVLAQHMMQQQQALAGAGMT